MSLVLRQVKGSKLTIQEMDSNLTYLESLGIGITGPTGPQGATGTGAGVTDVTYSELTSLISGSSLIPGSFYKITDFRTCYDQPDYNLSGFAITTGNYKQASISPIVVLATSGSTIASDAWQPEFPNDNIRYDISWVTTEHTGGTAYGRITERIDEWNNRTDYDHRTVEFKRYRTYTYDIAYPQAGTVSFSDGLLTGVETNFTSLLVNDIIAIPSIPEKFFKILVITSDVEMSLTGSSVAGIYSDLKYYTTSESSRYISYKQNNVDQSFQEFTTFGDAIDNDGATNNWIGNHSLPYIDYGEGEFILANNVFLDGRYHSNYFGNSCYNNTFDDDCSNNIIANLFCNNITNDDFDSNQIGNNFHNNVITANFRSNQIGEDFAFNFIVNSDFNQNFIGSGFSYNNIPAGYNFSKNHIRDNFDSNQIMQEFRFNDIGNDFSNNVIRLPFTENKIGEDFNGNSIYSTFSDNVVGNTFELNTLGTSTNNGSFTANHIGNQVKGNLFLGVNDANFYDDSFTDNELGNETVANRFGILCVNNTIGEYFMFNDVGDYFESNNIGNQFRHNRIGNNCYNNNISFNFQYNTIGHYFQSNDIESDFGYGGAQSYGNVIGNYFQYNSVGEYFYSNTIQDLFDRNIIGNYFRLNDVKVQNLSVYDFTQYYGNITSISDNTGASPSVPGTNGTYSGLSASGSEHGQGALFTVVVSGSVVMGVTFSSAGNQYQIGDELTILGSKFGGTDGVDIIITVNAVSTQPAVYGDYNCTIFKNAFGNHRLSYYDANDVLTINTSLIQ